MSIGTGNQWCYINSRSNIIQSQVGKGQGQFLTVWAGRRDWRFWWWDTSFYTQLYAKQGFQQHCHNEAEPQAISHHWLSIPWDPANSTNEITMINMQNRASSCKPRMSLVSDFAVRSHPEKCVHLWTCSWNPMSNSSSATWDSTCKGIFFGSTGRIFTK